jgi:hypothetical protein
LKVAGAVGHNEQVIKLVNDVCLTGCIHRSGNTRPGRVAYVYGINTIPFTENFLSIVFTKLFSMNLRINIVY